MINVDKVKLMVTGDMINANYKKKSNSSLMPTNAKQNLRLMLIMRKIVTHD